MLVWSVLCQLISSFTAISFHSTLLRFECATLLCSFNWLVLRSVSFSWLCPACGHLYCLSRLHFPLPIDPCREKGNFFKSRSTVDQRHSKKLIRRSAIFSFFFLFVSLLAYFCACVNPAALASNFR